MTVLVRPDVSRSASWIRMMEDFSGWSEAHGSGHWVLPEHPPLTDGGCRLFVEAVLACERPTKLPRSWVPSTFFWIAADDGELVGYLNLRHTLNDWLLEEGGHIGYSVRPSRRRQGHASRALTAGVRHAGGLGIEQVLVTCDDDNLASARTIERCGAVLEDVRNGKRRYWIATGS